MKTLHDGIIMHLKQFEDKIGISMESCEIPPEWIKIDFPLSKRNAIAVKLILKNVTKIIVDDKHQEEIKQIYDDATILQLELHDEYVDLLVLWANYPPKEITSKFEHIKLYASKI